MHACMRVCVLVHVHEEDEYTEYQNTNFGVWGIWELRLGL